jgi:hypothetical protein
MNFKEALSDFTYIRIEEVLLSPDNKSLTKIYDELDNGLEKLGINKNHCDELKLVIFQLIDSQNQLIYRQGLSDAISFLSSIGETKNELGI